MNIIFLLLLLYAGCGNSESIKICNRSYKLEYQKEYLKDEKLYVKAGYVKDPATNETQIGYFVEGKRNDTLFIYSKLSTSNDTLTRKNYHLFDITKRIDSTITKWKCLNGKLSMVSYIVYDDGKIIQSDKF